MSYAAIYDPDMDFDRWFTVFAARRIAPMLRPGDRILELGSATGLLTQSVAGAGRTITCVEREEAYLARARTRSLPGVRLVHADIASFETEDRFDHILGINVLHELPRRDEALRRLVAWLRPGGLLHVTLPNPNSLHRLAAVGCGMIGDISETSERGKRFGTLALQQPDDFVAEMAALGLRERRRGGIMVKPLPNEDMARLSDPLIEAWDALAAALPDHAAMTHFVFERADG